MNIREMTKEQLSEESLIDIAYAVLTEKGEAMTLKQLMDEVRKLSGITVREMNETLQQFYTDMNIDGRFLSMDDIRWGLREWYPVEQIEEETAPVVRVRKKRKKKKVNPLIDEDLDDDLDDEDDDEDEDEDELLVDGFDDIDDEDDEDDEDDDLDDDEEDEDIVEIEVDLLDPDDDLEILEDEDFEEEEEEEEEE